MKKVLTAPPSWTKPPTGSPCRGSGGRWEVTGGGEGHVRSSCDASDVGWWGGAYMTSLFGLSA